jgi:hypothetical protein
MGTATQVTDFSDLYTDLQNRLREQTGVTAVENQAKRYINIALHDMHIGYSERVPWAERRAVLRTQPSYTTGTVAVTKGSTTVTGTGTSWNTANDFGLTNIQAGGKITLGDGDVYEVASVGSDTSITLSMAFTGTTATESSYTYFEDEYALSSDFMRPIDQQRFSEGGSEIRLIGRTEFRARFPRNHTPGTVLVGTILDLAPSGSTDPIRKIRFHQPPSEAVLIPYSYVTSNLAVEADGTAAAQLVNDDDEPIVPLRYRHALVFHALYHWYRDKRDDTRSQEAKAEYTDLMLRTVSDFEVGQQRPSIRPKVASYKRRARRPWGGAGSRRYQTGDEFDTLKV